MIFWNSTLRKTPPEYNTPQGFRCPECGELCKIIPLLNEFDYAGTHVTWGHSGTHYPTNWGDPVTDCCLAPIDDYSENYEERQRRENKIDV